MSESRYINPWIGQSVQYFDSLPSTQELAIELAKKREVPEGTIIRTGHQTAGRGQANNDWQDAGYSNIALSIILYPTSYLRASQSFQLSKWAAVSVYHALREWLPGSFQIKWPNDLWHDERKLSGILIHTSMTGTELQYAVIGIGINVNQDDFGSLSQATSVHRITGKVHDLDQIMTKLIQELNFWFETLTSSDQRLLDLEYLKHLLGFQQQRLFRISGGEIFRASVLGVEENGSLILRDAQKTRRFGFKEIEWLTQ